MSTRSRHEPIEAIWKKGQIRHSAAHREDNANLIQRLQRLEQELNSIDVVSWRYNLKFLGVREPTRHDYIANADVIVGVLNECSSSRTWHHSDIERSDLRPQTAQ